MDYIITVVIIGIIIFVYSKGSLNFNIITSKFSSASEKEYQNNELIKILLSLDENSLNELFRLYKKEFGRGAAYYARRTYLKWKDGKVQPNQQTFKRFFVHLPKVMSYDLKCEVLRRLMEEYASKDVYDLTVYTDDWEEKLTPLVETIIAKSHTARLPQAVEEKLQWLAQDEMHTARDILKHSQAQEGKIAVSMLRQEISNVEILLENLKGNTNIIHEVKLPYGKINLRIKKR